LGKEVKDQLDAHKLPQMPATFALGVETNEVQRPATAQAIGAALLNSFNGDSSLKTGVALEFAPFRVWKTGQFTAEKWVDPETSKGWAILDSLALSAATTQGPVDAMGVQAPPIASVGALVDLINQADLRRSLEYYRCVNRILVDINNAATQAEHQPNPNGPPVRINTTLPEDIQKQLEACQGKRKGFVLELAGAITSTGEPAMATSKFGGGRGWLSLGYANKSWDLTFQADYRDRKEDKNRHDFFAGLRVDNTLEKEHRLAVALEAYYAGTDLNVDSDAKHDLGIGGSVDLTFHSGLTLSLGAQSRTDFSDFDLVVLTKISIAIDGQDKNLLNQYTTVH